VEIRLDSAVERANQVEMTVLCLGSVGTQAMWREIDQGNSIRVVLEMAQGSMDRLEILVALPGFPELESPEETKLDRFREVREFVEAGRCCFLLQSPTQNPQSAFALA
jgi:hypothetical protein